jgi:hypothetical protein
MSVTPTSTALEVRLAVRTRLMELLAVALPERDIDYGVPEESFAATKIWVGPLVGRVQIPNQKAARKSRQDDFVIQVMFFVFAEGEGAAEADRQVVADYQALENLLADDPSLSGSVPGLRHLVLDEVDGPNPIPNPTGYLSFVSASIAGSTRIN